MAYKRYAYKRVYILFLIMVNNMVVEERNKLKIDSMFW